MALPTTVALSRTVPYSVDAVGAWMERPGAVERLAPPWLPMTFRPGPDDLRDGSVDLDVVRVVRVTTRHDPDAYAEGRQFADEVRVPGGVTVPAVERLPVGAAALGGVRSLARRLRPGGGGDGDVTVFRHVHRYASAGANATTLTDEITAPAGRLLRGGLERAASYRSRQLSGDLQAHERMRVIRGGGTWPLTVGMTGASGTVGTALAAMLTAGGHRVVRLVRGEAHGPDERTWDPHDPEPAIAEGLDAIVHLAGAPIAGRFTARHKALVRDSRIGPTAALARVAGTVPFVSASAIGYYGADRGDQILSEDADPGGDFLADVVRGWENDAAKAAGRTVMVRTGIVQAAAGGALGLQRPLFVAGLGGRLGSGAQWIAWIALDDLVDVYYRAIVDAGLEGPVNAVAPHPVRQEEWAATMGRVLRRPAIIPTPPAGPALLLGTEGAQALALASQRVDPGVLREVGHTYRFPVLAAALGHELGRSAATVVRRA